MSLQNCRTSFSWVRAWKLSCACSLAYELWQNDNTNPVTVFPHVQTSVCHHLVDSTYVKRTSQPTVYNNICLPSHQMYIYLYRNGAFCAVKINFLSRTSLYNICWCFSGSTQILAWLKVLSWMSLAAICNYKVLLYFIVYSSLSDGCLRPNSFNIHMFLSRTMNSRKCM